MKMTPDLFEAFLKCPTKCWLRATAEPTSGNDYAEWIQNQNESYRASATKRLLSEITKDESVISLTAENLKIVKWRLAAGIVAQAEMNSCVLETKIDAVERIPAEGRGRPTQFIPIRFIFTNKLGKDERLLLAFDAFVLSKTLGRVVSLSDLSTHGEDYAVEKNKNFYPGWRGAEAYREDRHDAYPTIATPISS